MNPIFSPFFSWEFRLHFPKAEAIPYFPTGVQFLFQRCWSLGVFVDSIAMQCKMNWRAILSPAFWCDGIQFQFSITLPAYSHCIPVLWSSQRNHLSVSSPFRRNFSGLTVSEGWAVGGKYTGAGWVEKLCLSFQCGARIAAQTISHCKSLTTPSVFHNLKKRRPVIHCSSGGVHICPFENKN